MVGTAYFEGSFQFEEDGLLHEDFFAFMAESLDFSFQKVYLFGDFGVSDSQQFLNDVIDIDLNLPLHRLSLFYYFESIFMGQAVKNMKTANNHMF